MKQCWKRNRAVAAGLILGLMALSVILPENCFGQQGSEVRPIRIVLPKEFEDLSYDLSNNMLLLSDSGIKQQCSLILRLDARTYFATCAGSFVPDALQLSGFRGEHADRIPVSPSYSHDGLYIRLDGNDVLGEFLVSMPDRKGMQYIMPSGMEIGSQPGTVTIPLSSLAEPVRIFAKNVRTESCSLFRSFTLQEAINRQTIELKPQCKRNIITWPSSAGFNIQPLKTGGCLSTKSVSLSEGKSGIECVSRIRDAVSLVFNQGWEPVSLSAKQLSRQSEVTIFPQKKTIQTEIQLPAMLRQLSAGALATIIDALKMSAGCDSLTQSAENPGIYQGRCAVTALDSLSIPGFRPLHIHPRLQGNTAFVEIPEEELMISFGIVLEDELKLRYVYGEQKISHQQRTLNISLSELEKELTFVPEEEEKTPRARECRIVQTIRKNDLERALQGSPLRLSSPCRMSTVSWPPGFSTSFESTDCISRSTDWKNSRLACGQLPTRPMTIYWRGWEPIVLPADVTATKFTIGLADFVPRWPLQPEQADPLLTSGLYIPQSVRYSNAHHSSRDIPLRPEARHLPSLEEAGWPEEEDLPTEFVMSFAHLSQERTLPKSITFTIRNIPVNKHLSELFEEVTGLAETALPSPSPEAPSTIRPEATAAPAESPTATPRTELLQVKTIQSEEFSYSFDFFFLLYDSREACEKQEEPTLKYFFVASMMENALAQERSWALLVKGSEALSACAEGRVRGRNLIFKLEAK